MRKVCVSGAENAPAAALFLKEGLSAGLRKVLYVESEAEADFIVTLCTGDYTRPHGFTARSDGKRVRVGAPTAREVLYGVQDVLKRLFDYEAYAADEWSFTPREYDVLPVFDDAEEPSFPYRLYLPSMPDRRRQRDLLRLHDGIWADPKGKWFHTILDYLPYETYGEAHPDWYCPELDQPGGGRQVCYSNLADGGEAYKIVLEVAKRTILENPGKPNLSVTQNDGVQWCECPRCKAYAAKYGAEAAPQNLFLNRLADDISAWQREIGLRDDITIVAFAYCRSLKAPVKEEGGKIVPTAPEMVLRDNVGVIYAPIEMDYGKPITAPENAEFANNLRSWGVLCRRLFTWFYQTDFRYYLAPYDWFPTTQENYRFCRDLGVWCFYDQGEHTQENATAFDRLKTYITAKLLWNVDDDQAALTDNFFRAYFDIAVPYVRTVYDEILQNNEKWHREKGIGVEWYIYFEIVRRDIWSEEQLRRWDALFSDAVRAVDESDLPFRRQATLRRRIELERVSIRFLLVCLYDTDTASRAAFCRDLGLLGVATTGEGRDRTVSALKKAWGV